MPGYFKELVTSKFFPNFYIIVCYMFTLKNNLVILLCHFVQRNALTSLTQLVPLSSSLLREWLTGLCNTNCQEMTPILRFWLKILTC